MKPTVLTPITKPLKVRADGHAVELSDQHNFEIEQYWKQINVNERFTRGEIFHVHSIEEHEDRFDIILRTTDYAHYLHSVRYDTADDKSCKVVYGAGLVETKDSYFVFGEMANHTAYPGRLQCVGGSLSDEDKNGTYFDLEKSVLRELSEEIGIDDVEKLCDSEVQFIKTGGTYDFIAVLFHINLDLTLKEFQQYYTAYCNELIANGEQPEFKRLVTLKNNLNEISEFLKTERRDAVDYLFSLLEQQMRKA
ncbi:hypothetical protein [Fictibacillus barbaricus]|uniref:8-oxo-dGTP pyrophosphatase MutT (NUDIX family) n=1 Tax=Fictibacillus barbaricus TaxID=182136 RepID=A0ABU1TWE2_9BACL|nr:hypothetical protein [Fictibacillus barbaricus]MDR7071512.1 8-oxo-dGTP pyrophosphatase MutT (NUDIX family) [Fictibacillus barbaricus]